MSAKKAKDIILDRELCEGVYLSHSFFEQKENRLLTLLLKGFIVYLLSMGSIGFYLSALNINYNVVLCHVTIGIMAVLCAMLYYRLLVENMGYLFLLVIFGWLVLLFKDYINSGFYAIVNITVDEAAQYFDIDIQRLYNEQIGNRYLTVTMAAMFIGIVLDILLNVYVSRRMQYVTVIFIVMFLNVIPLYLVCEPDLFYAVMMMVGVAMTYCYKSGRHYSPQISVKRNNRIYQEKQHDKKRKGEISYVYNVKSMLQAGAYAVVFVLLVATIASAFRPKENFNTGYEGNKYKDLSAAAFSTLMTEGIYGFLRDTDNVGGLDSGILGNVSTVRLDYQTDLVVHLTPYSYDNVYLRGFVGEIYNPYQNCWTGIFDTRDYDDTATPEADVLQNYYDEGNVNSARGIMQVKNVGADRRKNYLPYYYSSFEASDRGFQDIVYYPYFEKNGVYIDGDAYPDNMPYSEWDLYVPDENIDAISQTVLELDWVGNDEEVISEVKKYFQDNIPYTISPGKTPAKKDFVNYFLTDNKKGYCAHFASAATLIFRYLGIPARYVEGYAIDYYQITDGEIVRESNYSDYYSGYSELGETALIEVNATDADAHAWVEVYLDGKGWQVVDVTPSSSGESEDEGEDFWSLFENVFGDSGNDAEVEINDGQAGLKISDELVRKICFVILGLALAAVACLFAVKAVKYAFFRISFGRADINDRLIMLYSRFRLKIARKKPEFLEQPDYRTQIKWLLDNSGVNNMPVNEADIERYIDILERAGFSNRPISEEEYDLVADWMNRYTVKK